ncbi:MAG: dienelactone hydrolase family protein [Betaproteobacteria bacterium]|nr:dienelactone hydrolase family protein [Betaproteobacteria bacterium]
MLSEIWSVDPNIRSICERLARSGIIALAPDLYLRRAAPPGEAIRPTRSRDPSSTATAARGIRDGRNFTRWLRAHAPASTPRSTSGASAWAGASRDPTLGAPASEQSPGW